MFAGTFVSYIQLRRIVEFNTPIGEIVRQIISAIIMAVGVYSAKTMVRINEIESVENVVLLLSLVSLGSLIYFTLIYILSTRFRSVLIRNLPQDIM